MRIVQIDYDEYIDLDEIEFASDEAIQKYVDLLAEAFEEKVA